MLNPRFLCIFDPCSSSFIQILLSHSSVERSRALGFHHALVRKKASISSLLEMLLGNLGNNEINQFEKVDVSCVV